MQESVEPETIADNLSEKQREILRVFEGEETRNTSHITTATGHPNNTVGHHIKETLIHEGLVDRDGTDPSAETVNPPNQYRLTELGQRVIDVYRQRDAKTEADISKVDELAREVETLQKENDRIRERLDDVEQEAEKNGGAISYIKRELNLG